jgi:mono/diheme cytochrome c family protein
LLDRGRRVFAETCARCHAGAAPGGAPIPAAKVGTDPSLAKGRARGTGMYRPGPLVGIAAGAPYLHDGTVRSLDELLSPARFDAAFANRFGIGPVPGHRAGTELPEAERAALRAFLETL